MSKQWVRQEIQRNEVATLLDRAAIWVMSNRQTAGAIAGAVVVVAALSGILAARTINRRENAWERFALAQSAAYQGQAQGALDQLRALSQDYAGTKASAFAQVFEGDVRFRLGNFKEAAETYQKIVDAQAPKMLVPIAMAGVGLSLESAGDCKGAIDNNQRFLDSFQDHYLAPQTHASLARCFIALGQKDQAKSALDRIALLYQESFWAKWAQEKVKTLS